MWTRILWAGPLVGLLFALLSASLPATVPEDVALLRSHNSRNLYSRAHESLSRDLFEPMTSPRVRLTIVDTTRGR